MLVFSAGAARSQEKGINLLKLPWAESLGRRSRMPERPEWQGHATFRDGSQTEGRAEESN
jgi:hypothetical protein